MKFNFMKPYVYLGLYFNVVGLSWIELYKNKDKDKNTDTDYNFIYRFMR